ncbi:hypothetical protein MBLNU459_g1273t1 [Dothideomycetes sp. NU459]
MTRTLPWLRGPSGAKPAPITISTSAASSKPPSERGREREPKRRRLSSPPGSDDDLPTGISTPDRRRALRPARTPSTSPPPAPPEQQPMREGYAEDDIWMMVEDEFHSTAKLYTSHLHHREYQRLKKLAGEREAQTIQRPVDARTKLPIEAQRAVQREEKEKSIGKAMKTAIGDDGNVEREDDDPWLGTQLAGLMEMPKRNERLRIAKMGAGRSNTRAAAGLTGADVRSKEAGSRVAREELSPKVVRREPRPEKAVPQSRIDSHITDDDDEDEDEDDLDAPLRTGQGSGTSSRTLCPTERSPEQFRAKREDLPSSVRHDRSFVAPARVQAGHESPSLRIRAADTSKKHDSSVATVSLPQNAVRSLASKYAARTAANEPSSRLQQRPSVSANLRQPSPSRPVEPDDFENTAFPSPRQPPQQSTERSFLARRREAQARKAKQENEAENPAVVAEVPTFLI